MYWRPKKAEHLSGTVQNPSSKFAPWPRDGLSRPRIVCCLGSDLAVNLQRRHSFPGCSSCCWKSPSSRKQQARSGKRAFAALLPALVSSAVGVGSRAQCQPQGMTVWWEAPASTGPAALPHILTFRLKPPWGVLAGWGDLTGRQPVFGQLSENLSLSNSPKLLDSETLQHLPFDRGES